MTHISDILDTDLLARHVADGLVSARRHLTLPLTIYNYTARCQFDYLWDDVTEQARGLIVDDSGRIVARSFRKCFNLGDTRRPETHPSALPTSPPEVTEKLDGSLGIHWRYDGEEGIATRGSFDSPQAQWATAWWRTWHPIGPIPDGWTLLFEIIYRANRVVVLYEREGLYLIGAVHIATGAEMPINWLASIRGSAQVVLGSAASESPEAYAEMDCPNREGVVLAWKDRAPPIRVKVKTATYKRYHRFLSGLTKRRIWEHLRDGLPWEDLLERCPDEHHAWLAEVRTDLLARFAGLKCRARVECGCAKAVADSRKEQAEYIKQHAQGIEGLVFGLLDGRDIDQKVWKAIEPEPELAPFAVGMDG